MLNFPKTTEQDLADWLEMALALWPNEPAHDLESLFHTLLASQNDRIVMCKTDEGEAIAFANLSIRRDYVEASTTSPVGYLEAIYVKPSHRKKGIGRAIVALAEAWTREQGLTELGSDTDWDNTISQEFHRRVGFAEESHIVHFVKKAVT